MTNIESVDIDQAATEAVVELLLQPEFSQSWLEEFNPTATALTEDQVEQLEREITRLLRQLAMPLIESLPEAISEGHLARLEKLALN